MNRRVEIYIRVDTNDGDYNEAINIITKKDLDKLRPLFKAIKNFRPYKGNEGDRWTHANNFPCGECLRDDLGEKEPSEIYDVDEEIIELLSDYLPSCEYGFHTIERVEISPLQKKERLV